MRRRLNWAFVGLVAFGALAWAGAIWALVWVLR